jgi:hypothetical protein
MAGGAAAFAPGLFLPVGVCAQPEAAQQKNKDKIGIIFLITLYLSCI